MSIRNPSGLNVLKRGSCEGCVGMGSASWFFQGGGVGGCAHVEEGLDSSWIRVMGTTLRAAADQPGLSDAKGEANPDSSSQVHAQPLAPASPVATIELGTATSAVQGQSQCPRPAHKADPGSLNQGCGGVEEGAKGSRPQGHGAVQVAVQPESVTSWVVQQAGRGSGLLVSGAACLSWWHGAFGWKA
jgi:hypothetical protein